MQIGSEEIVCLGTKQSGQCVAAPLITPVHVYWVYVWNLIDFPADMTERPG